MVIFGMIQPTQAMIGHDTYAELLAGLRLRLTACHQLLRLA
jgi:hypothetical protein